VFERESAPNLCASFSGVKERVKKDGTEVVDSAIEGKACCHRGSGTEEEMRCSRGRIRCQRMRPDGERAESNLTEPTGVEFSVANFLPLPITHFNPLKESLRTVATEYGASHETIRRIILQIHKQGIQQ
jgi:hypothetical protein